MILVLALILTLACVAWIFHPLITGRAAPLEALEEELTDVEHRKRMALLALRDVEYDWHAGKLDEEDYRTLKAQVSAEALAALDAEAREAAEDRSAQGMADRARIEAEIAELRAAIRKGAVCPHCAHPNPRGSRFCGACGAAMSVAVPQGDDSPVGTGSTSSPAPSSSSSSGSPGA